MNKLLNILKPVLFIGVGLSILYFVYSRQADAYAAECAAQGGCAECQNTLFKKLMTDFGSVKVSWLVLVFIVYIGSHLSRALRWNMLIEPLGVKAKTYNTFFAIIIGYMFNLALPRAGEVARPAIVARYEKLSLEKLFGTIVIDRLVDMVVFAALIALTFFLELDKILGFIDAQQATPVAGEAPKGSFFTSTLFLGFVGICVVGLAGLLIFRKQIANTKIYAKVVSILLGFWEGMKTIAKVRQPVMFGVHSLLIWVLYFMGMYLTFFAFEPTAALNYQYGLMPALLVFTAGSLGMLLPIPGGMGVFHFLTTQSLVYFYGLNAADGFAFANISFFFTQGSNIAVGLLGYFLLPILNKDVEIA